LAFEPSKFQKNTTLKLLNTLIVLSSPLGWQSLGINCTDKSGIADNENNFILDELKTG
jgi:hypothetical protein